jgi:hypothetical protein
VAMIRGAQEGYAIRLAQRSIVSSLRNFATKNGIKWSSNSAAFETENAVCYKRTEHGLAAQRHREHGSPMPGRPHTPHCTGHPCRRQEGRCLRPHRAAVARRPGGWSAGAGETARDARRPPPLPRCAAGNGWCAAAPANRPPGLVPSSCRPVPQSATGNGSRGAGSTKARPGRRRVLDGRVFTRLIPQSPAANASCGGGNTRARAGRRHRRSIGPPMPRRGLPDLPAARTTVSAPVRDRDRRRASRSKMPL